ncbi:MAG: hypothetical protein RH859_06625 [Longimicrobiales bacterium]
MRFAYIDSQGNEVPIPGVDALALRIELGAIREDTQLYDAAADRWGPAHTHEIFHTLSRAKDDDGFVAPPPPVTTARPEPAMEPEADEPDDGTSDEAASDEPLASLDDLAPDPVDTEPVASLDDLAPDPVDTEPAASLGDLAPDPAAPDPVAPEPTADDLGLDFTLAEGLDGDPAEPDEPGPDDSMDFGSGPAAAIDDDEDEAAFDFGTGTLELEPDPLDEPEGAEPPAADSVASGEGAMDFGGGMTLEEPLSGGMDFSPSAEDSLQLERPMSEFSADAPPAWMEQDGPSGPPPTEDDGSMDFTPGGVETYEDVPLGTDPPADEPARAERERPTPRNRPSPPRRPKERNLAGPVLGLLALAVLGGGGWFVWTTMLSGGGERAAQAPALPPVTIPDIPAELLPQMRDLAEQALAGTIADLSALQADFEIPAEPREEWLAGAYLANADDFPDVEAYWQGIAAFVDRVREVDTQVFHDRYVAAMEAAEVPEDTRPILLERADSGFLATREDRLEAYALMGALVDAALDLHGFLLSNQADIEYTPAAGGVSRDPVLEAVPATEELGDEMWGRVGQITSALDALGTLDRVTTERLTAVLFDRIRRAGIE